MKARIGFLTLATVAALMAPALAQDRPGAAPAPKAASGWTGFYAGGHFGHAWSNDPHPVVSDTYFQGLLVGPSFIKPTGPSEADQAFQGGLQFGYNWQFAHHWLLGVEGDLSWSGLKPGGSVGPLIEYDDTVIPGSSATMHADIRSLGSLRGRLGFAQPNWMAYVTGGGAMASIQFTGDLYCPGGGFCAAQPTHAPVSFDRTRSGWVVGGGVEFKGAESPWILGFEYLYYNFSGTDRASTTQVTTTTGAPITAGVCAAGTPCVHYVLGDIAVQTARLRLSYKFDWPGR